MSRVSLGSERLSWAVKQPAVNAFQDLLNGNTERRMYALENAVIIPGSNGQIGVDFEGLFQAIEFRGGEEGIGVHSGRFCGVG